MMSLLQKNDKEMNSFMKTLQYEIHKYVTSVSKNVYIDKLDDKGNNTIIHIISQLKCNFLI